MFRAYGGFVSPSTSRGWYSVEVCPLQRKTTRCVKWFIDSNLVPVDRNCGSGVLPCTRVVGSEQILKSPSLSEFWNVPRNHRPHSRLGCGNRLEWGSHNPNESSGQTQCVDCVNDASSSQSIRRFSSELLLTPYKLTRSLCVRPRQRLLKTRQ